MSEANENLQPSSYNLVDEPWIPVAGEAKKRSLMGIFTAPAPAGLSGNAVDKIVILRLLLSIAQASTKIEDEDAYVALSEEIIAENARKYLSEHRHLFDLYDKEKPFLQFPQLAEKGTADSCATLSVSVATGNKTVLTSWNREYPLSNAEKAVLLLRSTGFACGGKKYDSMLILSPGHEKGKTGKCGTLLGSYGYLHSYLKGENLWQTIFRNLFTESDIKKIANLSELGIPAWEKMPAGERDKRAEEYKNSYFGTLLPLDKFLLLTEDGIIKTDGIQYVVDCNNVVDPAVTTLTSGKEKRFLYTNTEKRPWRQIPALLSFVKRGCDNSPPYFLSYGLQKMRGKHELLTFWTGGAAVSSNSGEQYLSGTDDYVESEFSIECDAIGKQSMQLFETMMLNLDKTSKGLYSAVVAYFKEMNDDSAADWAGRATSKFWGIMESHADTIISLAFGEDATEENRIKEEQTWKKIIFELYDEFCPHESVRQIAAWAGANPRYSRKSKDKESKTKNKK